MTKTIPKEPTNLRYLGIKCMIRIKYWRDTLTFLILPSMSITIFIKNNFYNLPSQYNVYKVYILFMGSSIITSS